VTHRVERYETIVVGGGQAGLAAGYHLARNEADFIILERNHEVGDSWRNRWDSLRLFTPARYSGLPGLEMPALPMHLPAKNDVADYLRSYADNFDLPVRTNAPVSKMHRAGDRFVLSGRGVTYHADNVIVATGPFQSPKVPPLASQLARGIHQIHSSEYRNAAALPPGPALVVGVGNSGAQIAQELARTRRVWLAGRETGSLPRRLFARDIYDWIWPLLTKFSADTAIGRRIRERTSRGDPLVGISVRQIRRAGVERVGRLTSVEDGLPVCEGETIEPAVVVWSTGFRPDYRWIDLPVLGDSGYPRHERGVVAEAPGLYFLGLRFQHRLTSALLGGVGADAEYVVSHLERRRLPAHAPLLSVRLDRAASRLPAAPERNLYLNLDAL
jgi:putative flavoprotein involved in K+ transport